jgi:cytochrome c-type biogenesis protein CcmH/NrfG
LRKTVLIVASIVVVAGGAVAAWWWQGEHARAVELTAILDRAQSLAETEAGLSDAAVELERALALAPDDVRALTMRGQVCLRLARTDEAIERFRRASDLTEGVERARIQVLLGRAGHVRYRGSNKEEDFRTARNALQSAMLVPATQAEAMHAYGMLFLDEGKFSDLEKARDTFEDLLDKHPDYVEAPAVREIYEVLTKAGAGRG